MSASVVAVCVVHEVKAGTVHRLEVSGHGVPGHGVTGHGVTGREVFAALKSGPTDPDRLVLLLNGESLAPVLRRALSAHVPHPAG